MSNQQFTITVMRCGRSRVFIGTSDDIPGLTLESETFGKLLEAVMEVVPDLLMHNVGLSEDDLDNVTVMLVEKEMPHVRATVERTESSSRRPHPRYLVDAYAIAA